jgi:ElaB/YqjD/DUF883 family membrane-anchored ribosome-binding protein
MPVIKPLDEATQDFAADLAALRDDISKLTASVSELLRSQASVTTNTVLGSVDQARQKVTDTAADARQKLADTAADAQERVAGISADLEATIERNPLVAVLVAMFAGLLLGIMSRPRK